MGKFDVLKHQYDDQMNKLKLLLVEKSDQLEKRKKEEEEERTRMKEEVKGQAEVVSKLKREREISKGAWVSKEKKYQDQIEEAKAELLNRETRIAAMENKLKFWERKNEKREEKKMTEEGGVNEGGRAVERAGEVSKETGGDAEMRWKEERIILSERIEELT